MSNLPKDDWLDFVSSPSEEHKSSVAEELHRRYHKLVHYFLQLFRLPHEHREDLFNQVFLKIIGGLSKLKHTDNLKSWVVTITKNEILGYINKRDREKNLYRFPSNGNSGIPEHEFQASDSPTPEKALYINQLRNAFEEAVGQLDDSIALPFLMRYRDHMRWRQIAEALGLNEDTARKRSNRARDFIRDHFRKRFGSNSPMF